MYKTLIFCALFCTLFIGCAKKQDPEIFFEGGVTAFRNYQFVKAAILSQKAVDIAPDNTKYSMLLALSYLSGGDLKTAKEMSDREPIKSSQLTSAICYKMEIAGRYKMMPELEKIKELILSKEPDDAYVQQSIALAYFHADHFSEAIPFARKALSLEGRQNQKILLALILYESGLVDESKTVLTKEDFSATLIENDPNGLKTIPALLLLSKPTDSTKNWDSLSELLLKRVVINPVVQ